MSKEIRILIVDDDRLIRVAVKRILSRSGQNFIVDDVSNTSLLLEALKTKKYDCIILDYVLADATGIDILKDLNNFVINIPVIMMTGQGDELIAVKALKAGASDYLPKSILSHSDAQEILSYTIQNAIDVFKIKYERERTANALRKSEERYRSLVEHSPMLIMRFFPDDKTLSFVNDGFCEYFNTSREAMIGESVLPYILKENDDKSLSIINSLTRGNPVLSFDHYIETGNGTKWQLWTLQAFFDTQGNILEYQCIGEDITPLKEAEKELYNQKVYFQSILDSQENIIIVTDKKEIIEANHSFLIFFGYRNLDEFKKEHSDVIDLSIDIPGYISKKNNGHWIDALLNESDTERLISFKPYGSHNAKIFSVNINILSLEREVYVVTFSDVTALEQKSKSFEEKASIDALTGIFNKDKFYEMLANSIDASKRYKTSLSLIFFDIDHFKDINDTYGHQTGDEVLQTLVKIIKGCGRELDIFARWGGEEFVVLLPRTDLNNALKAAEKFRKRVMNTEFMNVKHLTCSFGVAALVKNDDVDKFVSRADKALYKAKESGRNRVVGIKAKL
ncbi:MAG: diguanylate cyclase [Spirochaetes bacterium]|nr:diguanylate cyclase [Spirochaetota bacterium]